jgi:hypothetical protein
MSLAPTNDPRASRRSAVLVAVQLPGVSDEDHAFTRSGSTP